MAYMERDTKSQLNGKGFQKREGTIKEGMGNVWKAKLSINLIYRKM